MKNIYNKKVDLKKGIELNLFNITYKKLNQSIDEVFINVKFGDPDFDFVHELKKNNAVFSVFKTHRQQNDLAKQLINDKGNLKNFNDFKTDTEKIIGKYNTDWLKTEYNTAVLRARQASNFRKFERDKDIYPNLKWLPSTSVEPRQEHVAFYNKIWAIDDNFWTENYPGNQWNCKCDVTNTDEGVTKNFPDKLEKSTADNGLEGNPAKTKKLFSDNNAYRKNGYLKPAELDKIAKQKANEVVYTQTVVKEYNNGGKVIESNLLVKKNDYKDLSSIANEYAKKGNIVEILPKIHFKDENYKLIFTGAYKNKCPDLKINNIFYEYESCEKPVNATKIRNMISRGLKQSDTIIIDNTDGATDHYILNTIHNRIRSGQKIKEVWLYEQKTVRLLYEKQKPKM